MSEAIPCPVRRHAEVHPGAPAVVTPNATWTWADLDRHVTAWAAHLDELTEAGGRVAVRAETSPRMVALVLAALRTGHVLVPLSPRLPEAAIREHLERIARTRRLDLAAAAVSRPPPTVLRPIPLDRPATVVFTSGSTGAPKAALHTAGNHVWSARGWADVLPLRLGDRWLLDLPLHHVGGLAVVYRCALAGAAVAIPAPKTPTAEAIRALGATHASLVATQLYRMLGTEGLLPETIRALLLGGSAIPEALLDEAHRRGWPVLVSYGLTEMASTVASTAPGASRRDLTTAGRVLPYREVAVRDGEIVVRGRTRFAGYVEGDALAEPFDADGWFATGDLGHVDAQGCLHVTGRRDNRFVSGGENVQPEAIEAVLLRQQGVVRAVVVPVTDAEFGQRPVAFVEAEGAMDPGRLGAAVEAALPRFMRPVAFHPWPEGEAGFKPSRAALRAEAERLKTT